MPILTILGLCLAPYAQARTLIVTHADTEYDKNGAAGPATRALFEDPSYNQKLLLIKEGGEKRLSFEFTGLQLKTVPSFAGEITWDDSDTELTLAGGYYQQCLYTTVWQIITQSKQNQNIHVDINATYTMTSSYAAGDEELIHALTKSGNYWGPPKTLVQQEAVLAKFNREDSFVKSLRMFLELRDRKESSGLHMILNLRGRQIGEFGRGNPRVVQINFN